VGTPNGRLYTYNTRGIRTGKCVEDTNTTFLLDGPNVAAEVENNAVSANYLWGANPIRADRASTVRYFIYNAHGDVVQLTDGTGTLQKSYSYDAFGNEKNPSSTDVNPFHYCGEYWDSETGTYYLRARYYDPAIGRFTQADTHWNVANMIYGDSPVKWNEQKADPNDPLGLNTYTYAPDFNAIMQSGNLYVYGMNNPITYIDQNGDVVISATVLFIAGSAALTGAIGGFVGNHIANKKGVAGWKKVGYIAGGVVAGGAVGAVAGAVVVPAATAAGFGGISITTAGVSTVAATGTSFGTLGTLVANNGKQVIDWANTTAHGIQRMAERGVTQAMANTWVQTGKALRQSGGQILYITRQGAVVVNKAGQVITAYGSKYFDANMVEVVKKLFGK